MTDDKVQVVEIGTNVEHTPLEYIYVTIPAEYVCVYHRILIMLADYGVDMLKDCKATCKDRNSGVIECFNMFNAAVAARKLGGGDKENKYSKLAETLIKYIKAKINQIYSGKDNSPSFVFPVDENGELKAYVSCGERPKFWINAEDGDLYKHKFHNGFDEHFRLGKEDLSENETVEPVVANMILATGIPVYGMLDVTIDPSYEVISGRVRPCADVKATFAGKHLDLNKASCTFYFDGDPVVRFNDVIDVTPGAHLFECVVNYRGLTAIDQKYRIYEA